MTTLYSTVGDLRQVLDSTDAGTGTAAQLTDAQLTLALRAASNRVSVYVGTTYDSSSPTAMPPDILADLTLDLAAFWATKTYLKHKDLGAQHPVYIAYKDALDILVAVRDGKIRLDVGAPGTGTSEVGAAIINRIPNIFTDQDANIYLNPVTGALSSSAPDGAYQGGWGSEGDMTAEYGR